MYDGGIEALGLHLRATCREHSVARFRVAFCFKLNAYYVYDGLSLS